MNDITDTQPAEFARHLAEGMRCWERAGEILAAMVERDGEAPTLARLREEVGPMLTGSVFRCFLRLGRGEMIPELMVEDAPWAVAALVLPRDAQRALVDSGRVDVVAPGGRVDSIPLADLTPVQCRALFSDAGVASVGWQKRKAREERERKAQARIYSPKAARATPAPYDDDDEDADDGAAEEIEVTPVGPDPLATALANLIEARASLKGKHEDELTDAIRIVSRVIFELKEAAPQPQA